jgi:hypothetical protein
MKTLHTNTRKVISNHGGNRMALAIAGIVIAILCSIALLQDVRSAEAFNANVPSLLETSRIVVSDFVGIEMVLY